MRNGSNHTPLGLFLGVKGTGQLRKGVLQPPDLVLAFAPRWQCSAFVILSHGLAQLRNGNDHHKVDQQNRKQRHHADIYREGNADTPVDHARECVARPCGALHLHMQHPSVRKLDRILGTDRGIHAVWHIAAAVKEQHAVCIVYGAEQLPCRKKICERRRFAVTAD